MANTIYLGNKVGGITNMPFDAYGYGAEDQKYFDKFLKSDLPKKYPYLFAVTANYYQKKSKKTFEQNGFKAIKTFYSSHDNKEETLTLWAKINKDFNKNCKKSKEKVAKVSNCSVSYDREAIYRCVIISQDPAAPGDTNKNLNKEGFSKVRNMPIWFKIAKKHLVKVKNKPKPPKSKLQKLS